MITVVLIALDGKELVRGTMDQAMMENSTIVCRNGRYFTFVRHDNNVNACIYKERLAPLVIREF